MGASVRQRLLNYAKTNNRPFAEVLQYYAMERFLYRLSVSPHASKFLLKGALLLTAWRAPMSRPTMDIDLLGRTSNEVDDIVNLLKEVAQVDVPDADAAGIASAAVEGDHVEHLLGAGVVLAEHAEVEIDAVAVVVDGEDLDAFPPPGEVAGAGDDGVDGLAGLRARNDAAYSQ